MSSTTKSVKFPQQQQSVKSLLKSAICQGFPEWRDGSFHPGPRKLLTNFRMNFNCCIQLSSVWDQHKDAVEVWPVSFIADKFNYELSCLWGAKKRNWIGLSTSRFLSFPLKFNSKWTFEQLCFPQTGGIVFWSTVFISFQGLVSLTQPMANIQTLGDSIFTKKNKVEAFISWSCMAE